MGQTTRICKAAVLLTEAGQNDVLTRFVCAVFRQIPSQPRDTVGLPIALVTRPDSFAKKAIEVGYSCIEMF